MRTKKRKAVILHNPVSPDARLDDLDLLEELASVSKSFYELGWSTTNIIFDTDISVVKKELEKAKPEVVFNLVETFEGKGSHQYLAPALLEHWGYRYTGGTAESLFITTDKLLAKELLTMNGIPTPDFFMPRRREQVAAGERYIVKAIDEDASLGIDDDSIIRPRTVDDISAIIRSKEAEHKVRFFAERYIDGREFNLTVIGDQGKAQVLNPAEICFLNYAADKPKIIDYRAKWVEDSFEYENTQRTLDFGAEDAALIATLSTLAARCWDELRLTGYARVDFRVDTDGKPWVLEVNVNPCISPHGGVIAAVARAGLSYTAFLDRIIAEALR